MPKTRSRDPSLKPPVPAAIPRKAAGAPNSFPSPGAKSTPAFFKIDELAERWGLSGRQVRRYLKSDVLIATRFGRSVRIRAEEVARFEAERSGVS